MICKNCGQEIEEGTYMCAHCGVAANMDYSKYTEESYDAAGCFSMIISFLMPFVGLILYCAWHSTKPKSASTVGKCALVGFVLSVLSTLIGVFAKAFYQQ